MPKTNLYIIAILMMTVSPITTPLAIAADEEAKTNKEWWPDLLDLSPLRQNDPRSNPYGESFNYAEEFKKLDLAVVKKDIAQALTTSQSWWPADYGNYGPFFIRMAWHSAGTYRTTDGRGGAGGGQQRFEPLNSWPDNANLDKARRLLWPIKQKYGRSISWADLMILAGNVALESMGFKTLGFAGGREDDFEPDTVYWGPEKKWLESQRFNKSRELKGPVAASQMGLIYVNPEGLNGNSDPLSAATDIRQTFGRMAMNDEEIVALIAGGHTFGKTHGAHNPNKCLGPEPAAAPIEQQGLGWANKCGKGNAEDTITSGLEGAWTSNPVSFTTQYLDNLFAYDWIKSKSPAGATQWIPSDKDASNLVPDAHDPTKSHAPIMLTTDLTLKVDPKFKEIALRFQKNPDDFSGAFARAWFKLTHRDLGPRARYLGPDVPKQVFLWQDPIPAVDYVVIDPKDILNLKAKILASGLSTPELVKTAWASAATYRGTDQRGGANGARIRLAPEKDWPVNDPAELSKVLEKLTIIQKEFNTTQEGRKKVSLADIIILSGNAAIERAAAERGSVIEIPFTPGRNDANQEQTDIASFSVLEPKDDGFRNFYAVQNNQPPTELFVNRANYLTLSVPETTVLLGGLRSLNANSGNASHGVFTQRPGTLSNDFFVNLLDPSISWSKSTSQEGIYEGRDRSSGAVKWTATPVDLIFGSNSELRAVAEVYASKDGNDKFVKDFVAAWTKVTNLDRFDIKK